MLTFLKSDHPLIIKQDNVRNLCADFFNANPLHYFTLVRCFHDGSFFPMGTHAQFILDWFDIFPIISVYHERYEHSQKYTFLWDEVMPEEGMDMAISKHGIYNGITIIYRYKSYFDIASFAMPEERSLAGSYYLSSLKRLEDFYEDFLKKARDLINIFDTTKVKLPFEKQDKNADSLFLNALKTRLILKRPAGNSYLTSREVMCLQMLEEGKSYKYISSIFDVSPRTIETYISRAKKRTDIHNINDILKLLRIS